MYIPAVSGTVLKSLAKELRLGDEALIDETIDSTLAQQTSTIGALLEKQLVNEHEFLREICAQYRPAVVGKRAAADG